MRIAKHLSVFLIVFAISSCGGEFPPDTPGNLTVTPASPVKMNLSWGQSKDDIELAGYMLYRGGALIQKLQVTDLSHPTTYSDTGLTGNTQYCYKVSAYDAAGNESKKSDEVCAATPADTGKPTAPSGLTATASSYSQINLSWNASTDDYWLSGYKIYRYGIYLASTGSTTLAYSDLGLSPSTTYCYSVAAYDSSGNESAQSAQSCVTTLSPTADLTAPSVPLNPAPTLVTSKRMEFTWDVSTDEAGGSGLAGYKLYRQEDNFAAPFATATANSYSSTGLTGNIKYCYRVSAYDNAGNESAKGPQVCATTLSSPQWVVSTIDKPADVGMYASIAVDSQKKVHMSFYDYSNGDLRYAIKNGAIWEKTVIDGTGDVGMFSDMAVDSNGKAHVSYYDYSNGTLKYATNSSGSWATATLDSGGVGWDTSIAADSTGGLHISYFDYINGDLKYISKGTSDPWDSPTTVDSTGNVGQFSSIAIDSGNNVHIGYYDFSNGDLKYANGTNSVFSTAVVDNGGGNNVGWYASIVTDSTNLAHVSYYDVSSGALKYAVGALGSGFSTTTVDTGVFTVVVEDYSSIFVDSSMNAHISYYDGANGDLKYATGNYSSGFTKSVVDTGGGNNVGSFNSIASDSTGAIHIGYYDYDALDLKYAIFE